MSKKDIRPNWEKYVQLSEGMKKEKEKDPHSAIVADLEETIIIEDSEGEEDTVMAVQVDFDEIDSDTIDIEQQKSDDTASSPQKKEYSKDQLNKKYKSKSVVLKIEEQIGKQLLFLVHKHSRIINEAGIRAIALQQTIMAEQKKEKDLIFEALDMVTQREVNKIIDAFVAETETKIKKSKVKRLNISEAYTAYAKFVFTAKQIEEDEMLKIDDRVISLDELRRWHLASSGFLTAPIEIYKTYIQSLLQKDKDQEILTGRIRMGGEKYIDFLDNLSIINLFKEDFFNVF